MLKYVWKFQVLLKCLEIPSSAKMSGNSKFC
jgi:hypothetical protein